MYTIPDSFKLDKFSVWDTAVPIVEDTTAKTITIYLTDSIETPDTYNEFFHRVISAPADYTIHLHINTPGGYIDAALMIRHAIQNTRATVVGHLTGTVASAGTVIALACNDIVVADHTSFMIHNYSGGMQGKGHEMKAHQQFVDKNLNIAFADFYQGFLSTKEMQSIIDGQDLWLNKDEVLARWASKHSDIPSTPKRRGRPSKANA